MSLKLEIDFVKNNTEWKSVSRIIGRAGEIYCCNKLKCPNCNSKEWIECDVNKKSKDQICKICNKNYQIKCKKITTGQHTKIITSKKVKMIGAEYNTTLKSLDENIDYIVMLYDKNYFIIDVLNIKSQNLTKENIIPRTPLSKNAKRGGWQGCNLIFNNFESLNIKNYS
jgi:hypothetical protein